MPDYTENLNLAKPLEAEQFNIATHNNNLDIIDNFAGQTPARALTADVLTTARNINGVSFKGNTDIVTGLGMYSETVNYSAENLAYKVINGKTVVKKSVIDNNLGNDFNNNNYWIDAGLGGGQWGEITGNIQDQTDLINLLDDKANTSLNNLTSDGYAKFQYALFSINNGTVDSNGNNATLQTVGDVSVSVDKYFVPVMANNTATDVSVSYTYAGSNAYLVTNSGTTLWYSAYGGGSTCIWTFTLTSNIPSGAICNMSLTGAGRLQDLGGGNYLRGGTVNPKITFVYSDNTSEVVWSNTGIAGSGSTTWTPTVTTAKEVKQIKLQVSSPGANSAGDCLELYAGNFTVRAQYTVSSADTLICNPCTITTADNRTKIFAFDNTLDCSLVSDGTYRVVKNFQNGGLSLVNNVKNEKTTPPNEISWSQPQISSSGTVGGNNFACFSGSATDTTNYPDYYAFDGLKQTTNYTYWYANGENSWNNVYLGFYNPIPLKVTLLSIHNNSTSDAKITAGNVLGSNDGINYTTINNFTNSNTSSGGNWTIDLSSNTQFYKYYKIQPTASTKTYRATISEVTISATLKKVNNGDLWLDTSKYPLTLKQYDGSNWQTNNELVYIGDLTVSNGVITSVKNNPFNWNGVTGSSAAMPSNRYVDLTLGASGSTYTAPADGWISAVGTANTDYGQFIISYIGSNLYAHSNSPNQYGIACVLPVKKGQNFSFSYYNAVNTHLRFIYAEGA